MKRTTARSAAAALVATAGLIVAAAPGASEDDSAKNVLGQPLQPCSTDPMTGWFRDGTCRTDDRDRGVHVVCAQVTEDFLRYSKSKGNDLITPRGSFVGLNPGDRWCLCAGRWNQARRAGVAPKVVLEASHAKALKWADLDVYRKHTID